MPTNNTEKQPLSPVVNEGQAREIAKEFGTPTYVYSQKLLEQQANKALAFPNEFGLIVRYAMKANSNVNILKIFHNKGISIDASSTYEVERAVNAGVPLSNISLTSQQVPKGYNSGHGACFNACSLNQLKFHGLAYPRSNVGIRINPGLGSGGTNRTNTGGPSSSFGIWHEQFNEILEIAKEYDLCINRVHTHIGSGSNPKIWKKVSGMSLDIVKRFLDAGHEINTLNLGGGYKIGRMEGEESTNLQECGEPVRQKFIDFYKKTGVRLKLEIEPGTFLVANAGAVIATAIDIKSTPDYNFIITDSGMTEVTRPSLYGAQHPISVVSKDERKREPKKYIVSGHCCESGDILTPKLEDPETLAPRFLDDAKAGDLVVVGGTGAYCSSMPIANYNSYPKAAEVLIDKSGKPRLIRKRETLEQITGNEIVL